ncbi:MAG TPA: DNA polymerase [Spirochaetota bacterium]|nr:MAG: DNA polymerase IV [Spirochaetes bacterium ADurb.BinA120]HPI15399.1 DNA polymerase [Spirochaetota bacterium]HPO46634.1 DNA polymerase [Spirochaetota bacterium]
MERQVIHLNVAHFMAAVEEALDPSLKGRPFVIAPEGAERAVAVEVSRAAFSEGLRRGMPLAKARAALPGLKVLPVREALYRRAGAALFEIASGFSPLLESPGGGHLFVDITGTRRLFGHPVDCAARLREEAVRRAGLRPVAGLAVNRLVSKIGTRVVKPDGFVVIGPGDEPGFLRHQQVSLVPGVGEKLLGRLGLLGIREMGELASLSDSDASAFLGRHGPVLRDRARGIDSAPLSVHRAEERGIRASHLFDTDTSDTDEIEAALRVIVEDAGVALRSDGLAARAVEVGLSYSDRLRARGFAALSAPTWRDAELFRAARTALYRAMTRRVRVRRVAVALLRPIHAERQAELFAPPEAAKEEALQAALDSIRSRYGRGAVRTASAMNLLA